MANRNGEDVAFFVDLENFVGFSIGQQLNRDLSQDLRKLTEYGRVVVRKSFGDIYKIPLSSSDKEEIRTMLQDNLIQHEDVRHRSQYKNSSDIKLVIEVLSIAYTNPSISTFVIVAEDRDYVPLFTKLREMGKTVIGIGGSQESTDEYYRSACDNFFYHKELAGTTRIHCHESGNEFNKALCSKLRDAEDEVIALFIQATKTVEEECGKLPLGTTVAEMMRTIKPGLDFADYGLRRFKDIANLAMKRGFIHTQPHGWDFRIICIDSNIDERFIGQIDGFETAGFVDKDLYE